MLAAVGVVAVAAAVGLRGSDSRGADQFEFVDVATDAGLDVTHSAFRWDVTADPVAMMGAGVCWIDVDRDGWLDLFVTDAWANGEWGQWNEAGPLPTTRIFRNENGRFAEYTGEWAAGVTARTNGCVAADFDADGYTDLYVTTERANLLLWNERGEGFTEGAEAAGLDSYGWHTGAAAGDINGDGLVDLVVAGYADLNRARPDASTGFPNTYEPVADLVFLNQGSRGGARATFGAVDAGLEPDGAEYGLGVVLVDIDRDGDLDLHVANDTQPNRLYLNDATGGEGGVVFRDVSSASGTDDPNSGMGIGTADINGDLLPDVVVTNLEGQGHGALATEASAGNGPRYAPAFDSVRALGFRATGWGTSFGDFDLDGDQDLVVASGAIPITALGQSAAPLTYFSNDVVDGAQTFVDASVDVGLSVLAPRNGRAVAVADYDNDGDLDVAVSAVGQSLVLLENREAGGSWLMVDPGVPTPGLRVRVQLTDGTVIERYSSIGGSWLSSEDPRIHIGLRPEGEIESVEVRTLDGSILYQGPAQPNQTLEF